MIGSPIDQKHTIDARGLACPLPLLKLKQGLSDLVPGESLQIMVTDSGSVKDFHAFAALSCHLLKDFKQDGEIYYYVFVKGDKSIK